MPSTGVQSQFATGSGTLAPAPAAAIAPSKVARKPVAQFNAVRLSSGSASSARSLKSDRKTQPSKSRLFTRSKSEASEGPLPAYFDALLAAHGPQHWWPGRTRFEIIVGAILTQNTSWTNVERAIANLRRAKLLSPEAIFKFPSRKLATLLRPSGYFRQKTKTLKTFVALLFRKYRGSLTRLFATPTVQLREQLLSLRGIGPETADSILLYAGKRSVFVVDAYTRRILERHRLAHGKSSYEEISSLFESALRRDHQLFNEFHALIVHTGKQHCRKSNPACGNCPLSGFLPDVPDSPLTNHSPRITSHPSLATGRRPLVAVP